MKSFSVDCIWGKWSSFSDCSKSCDRGSKTRNRRKIITEKNNKYLFLPVRSRLLLDKSKTSKLFRFLNRPKKVWSVEVLYVIVLKDISKYLVLDNPWKAFLEMERLTWNVGRIDTAAAHFSTVDILFEDKIRTSTCLSLNAPSCSTEMLVWLILRCFKLSWMSSVGTSYIFSPRQIWYERSWTFSECQKVKMADVAKWLHLSVVAPRYNRCWHERRRQWRWWRGQQWRCQWHVVTSEAFSYPFIEHMMVFCSTVATW